jgi:hypothetical protein
MYGKYITHVSCPSAGHCSQVCHSYNPESFPLRQRLRVNWPVRFCWRNCSQFLQSFLPDWLLFNLPSCSMSIYSFQRSLRRDPKIPAQVLYWNFAPQDRTSKFRQGFADKSDLTPPPFFPSFIAFLLHSFHLLCCALLISSDLPWHLSIYVQVQCHTARSISDML